jgi:hypothetical protein
MFIGARNLQGLTGGTIVIKGTDGAPIAGYVSPNLQGFDLTHKATVDRVANQSGNTASLIITDEFIQITFDFIPQGTSLANALKSATIPPPGATAAITGLPIIPIGSFADGLNTDGTSTQPWIYETDAGVNGKAKEKWEGKITLTRYVGITSGTAIA